MTVGEKIILIFLIFCVGYEVGFRRSETATATIEKNICEGEKILLEADYRQRIKLVEECEILGALNSAREGWEIVYSHCPIDSAKAAEVVTVE